MAKQKEKKNRFQEAKEAELKQRETKRMMKEIHVARTRAHEQMARERAKYEAAKERGDYKEASRALKMWNFFRKMCLLADKFTENLERIQSIQDLLNILQGTCQLFKDLVNIDNMGMFRDMKSNLKKFKKKLKQYEDMMDSLFGIIDTVLDEKPNIFVRFFNWIRGVKPKTDEELLKEQEEALAKELAMDANEKAGSEGNKGETAAPSDGGDNFGSDLVY